MWTFLQDKFLINKAFYLEYSLKELQEIEGWVKESGRLNPEVQEILR